jgi:ribosomal protein S18 acetylase RimI-like enzyme
MTESDFDTLMVLARQIWREHYVPMVGQAQVDYMLGTRFTPAFLRRYINASDRWLDILTVHAEPVGYCSYALTDDPHEIKLEQLYLNPSLHGQGLGGQMMRHVIARALALGRTVMMLQVNKNNHDAIAVYRKMGFTVREEARFDIGQGFVMDDYIMEKVVSPLNSGP